MVPENLQYPTGKFEYGRTYSTEETRENINKIAQFPAALAGMHSQLSEAQLGQTYRPGAWSARQLINHLGDVYVNAYLRTKWLLTEDRPIIKVYDENGCALLPDSNYPKLQVSLNMISSLVERWVFLLNNIPESSYSKILIHPEYGVSIPLDELVAMYAWHGYHHLAHLQIIKDATG